MKRTLILLVAVLLAVATQLPAFSAPPEHAKNNKGGGNDGGGDSNPPALSVCIDPGHGGIDPGTTGGDIRESQLNLDVSLALATKLEAETFEAHLTRTTDTESLSNNDRYTLCNATNASTLVSVHHNGSTSDADYSLALYHQGSSKNLATTVGQAVASEFGLADTFRIDRYPSGVLIKSDMPSMMSEGYFLTNSTRIAELEANYDAVVEREAEALLQGILSYYGL